VHQYAVTVIGHDRPAIIADVTEVLAGLGLNLTDSTMTRLRGHFAMTLICSGPDGDPGGIIAALDPLTADGSLVATVRSVAGEAAEPPAEPQPPTPHVLTVHGADRLGIVAALTRALAEADGNITDLTTRLVGDLYVLVAEVDLPAGTDVTRLAARVGAVGDRLGVEATLRPADVDVL